MTGIETPRNAPVPRDERMARTSELFALVEAATDEQRTALHTELVLLNRCVADSIASRYAGRGIAADDLRQVAYEGLVKAVHRFEPGRDKNFLTFAVPTIRGEVQRHFRDHGWSIRPPRRIQELQQRIARAGDRLGQELGREPTAEEMAEALGVAREEYDAACQAFGAFAPTSLDQPQVSDGERSVGETIPDETRDQQAAEARMLLAPMVRNLPARDRRLLYLRFYEDRTQAEIGEEFGVTQMQVSRLLSGIYSTLREGITD